MNWVPPELLKNTIDNYFFEKAWYDWCLVEFLEFKKGKVLARDVPCALCVALCDAHNAHNAHNVKH